MKKGSKPIVNKISIQMWETVIWSHTQLGFTLSSQLPAWPRLLPASFTGSYLQTGDRPFLAAWRCRLCPGHQKRALYSLCLGAQPINLRCHVSEEQWSWSKHQLRFLQLLMRIPSLWVLKLSKPGSVNYSGANRRLTGLVKKNCFQPQG